MCRIVRHCPERVLLRWHEVIDLLLKDFLKNESLSSEIGVVVCTSEYHFVAEIEKHDQISAPALEEQIIAASKARIEPKEDCAL